MPMSVSPDRKTLVVALRSPPFTAVTFAIDRASGALSKTGAGALAASLPYIRHDATGRWLLGASYGEHLVSVNAIGAGGVVGEPHQVLPTAQNAHAIVLDRANRYAFVPHLGTDQVFQFRFDAATGKLSPNTPPFVQLAKGSGPRHAVVSADNRFVFLLNELTATVTTFSIGDQGCLKEIGSVPALPPGSPLRPGVPRPAPGRDVSNDIWASDLHLTPDGRFLYAAERTSSTLAAFRVDGATGKLTFIGSTPTEKQPRGFRIDPAGRALVACGELSDHLATYAIGPDGALRPLGRTATGKGANWVEIIAFN
jgi:6-phosphogluconolactonase